MTTTTKPAPVIDSNRGPKPAECPFCGHEVVAHYHDNGDETFYCRWCDADGGLWELADAPDEDALPVPAHPWTGCTVDDPCCEPCRTLVECHQDWEPIGDTPAHCWGCDDRCTGTNAGTNRACPCRCH